MTIRWEKVGMDMPTGKWVYNVRFYEIGHWIESQPIHMWKFYDIPMDRLGYNSTLTMLSGSNYLFTDEMESWFLLRWS